MNNLIEDVGLKGKKRVFADREEAGRSLASLLEGIADPKGMVLAIPAGGVPVACAVARECRLPLDVLIVCKIQIPDNPEAGFGAIGPDGEVLLNERIVEDLRLSQKEIQARVSETQQVLQSREKVFRRGRPQPELKDRQVILVDDGLASGYTMMAAVGYARQKEARQVIGSMCWSVRMSGAGPSSPSPMRTRRGTTWGRKRWLPCWRRRAAISC